MFSCSETTSNNLNDRHFDSDETFFILENGDLLFQDLDCGPTCDAIEAVTTGVDGYNISHIGLVIDRVRAAENRKAHSFLQQSPDAEWLVLESLGDGVILTPLDQFLSRSLDTKGKPKVAVGRLIRSERPLIALAVRRGLEYLGTPYDARYKMGDESLYCSEMIHLILTPPGGDRSLFPAEPMTFKSPDDESFFPVWVEYFRDIGMEIPEGELGVNPAGISLSPAIRIVRYFGELSRQSQ